MKIAQSLLLTVAFALPLTINAEAPKETVKKEATKKVEQSLSKDAVAAANKLFDAMSLKEVYANIVNASTMSLVRREPRLKSVEDKIHSFYSKYIGWSAVKDDMAKIYAKYYTANDLNELAKFYQTDLGKKTLKMLPKISRDGRTLGIKKVMSHQKELQDIVQKALQPKESTEPKKESKK